MPSKIQIKLFAEQDVHVEDYVPVFHRWIRESVLTETLVDVVSYTHVADGPAVVLIGHERDYALDRGGKRLGLLVSHKRGAPVDFRQALARAAKAAKLLEGDTGPAKPIRFRTDELVVRLADRLNAPNTDETYERMLPELRSAFESVYGSSLELARIGAPRELFTVRVSGGGKAPELAELG